MKAARVAEAREQICDLLGDVASEILEVSAKEGIGTAEADAARLLCERLEEYHWQRGHEREAEAAALALSP